MLAISSAFAAEHWTEYRSGPFHVISDSGDRPSRERLAELEQLRYVLGTMLGKEGFGQNGLDTIWPIDVVLFANTRAYGPHALPKPLLEGGSAMLSAWTADVPLPRDFLGALTRLLIDDNAGRMPDPIEAALCDLFSTIKVNATKVTLGAPLPKDELPPDRMRAWAKIQMLATNPDYSGKVRVYLNNLQQGGDEAVATRNAFDITVAELDRRADAYLRAAKFEAVPVSGRPLNPNRDFVEKPADAAAISALMSELAAGGKGFPADSPRGLVSKGTRPALELAAKANPRWAEPHFRIAALETNPVAKIKELKTAATLEPRNPSYWQALAEAQMSANSYADAEKSWAAAERAAPTDADRTRIRQARTDMEDRRAAFEAAEKKRRAEEQARELQRVKDSAAAEVHAAEDAANRRLGPVPKSGKAAVPWWDDPQGEKISGTLTRVDCLNGPLRLTIQMDGVRKNGMVRLLVRDPKQIAVHGSPEAVFGCGVQRPPRKIKVVHNAKADAKMGTVGDVAVVEFP
ncbi:MAG: hypothetical protein DMG59_04455 [Acidobacteria bacterium]|nr:MAG: hypothetical protein DMG59_04455 [Acidobacteriota bacterium]